ncbi:hypothetical protein DES53_10885 [Roseimicrobium gellanilyticum]|uniref:Uncharacterized protein n=1 Tax=Roseimicrobium gellanilyticum TaxID=748857 RepID=A0A366HFZ2_9BACT|nr:hypothetical protein [Roseimicrobium gellanilyticum]RBP40378.1 hypothetical protein DES53_10885 [Roseimicrobium gellanilyticum]
MEHTPENITAFRAARWRVRTAKIAAAMCGGWPLSDGLHTREYAQCMETLRKAEEHLASFPQEWLQLYDELRAEEESPHSRSPNMLGGTLPPDLRQPRGE